MILDDDIRPIGEHCFQLEELVLGDNDQRFRRQESLYNANNLLFVLERCTMLQRVSIHNFSLGIVSNNDAQRLCSYGHLFVDIEKVGGFNPLLRSCSQLKRLQSADISSDLLQLVARSCPLIQDLLIRTLDMPTWSTIGQNCTLLQRLELNKNYILAYDERFFPLTEQHIRALQHCELLEELHITDVPLSRGALSAISELRHVKKLSISYLNLDDASETIYTDIADGLRAFEATAISRTLEKFTISSLTLFSSSNSYKIAIGLASCHLLKIIRLRECVTLDNKSLDAIREGCPLVEGISFMTRTTGLTFPCVLRFVTACKALNIINPKGCFRNKILDGLAPFFPDLDSAHNDGTGRYYF